MRRQIHGCGLEAALAVVGGKWKPIVLWRLAGTPAASASCGGWWTASARRC